MEWVKLHTDILGDDKLRRAARKGAKGLEYLPWLIVFAKAQKRDGRLVVAGEPAEPEDIAEQIPGNPVRAVAACLEACERLGILARDGDGALAFTKWHDRNAKPPSSSPEAVAERVRRHREKQSGVTPPDVTPPDNTVTTLQGVTRENVTSEERAETSLEVEGEVRSKKGERERASSSPPPDNAPDIGSPDDRQYTALLAEMGSGHHIAMAVDDFLSRVGSRRAAWVARLLSYLRGDLGAQCKIPAAKLFVAVLEYNTVELPPGATPNANHFHAFAMKVRERVDESPVDAMARLSKRGGKVNAGDATYLNARAALGLSREIA